VDTAYSGDLGKLSRFKRGPKLSVNKDQPTVTLIKQNNLCDTIAEYKSIL